MSFYATTTAIASRCPDLELADTATSDLVSACLDDASAEVDKYLSRRYDLTNYQTTTAAIPPMMRSLTIRLAEAYVWQRNSRGAKESLKRGDNLEKAVIQNLIDLRDYDASLVDTSGALIANDPDAGSFRILSNTKDYRDTFNEGKSAKWKVSATKLSDIPDGD